jgi:hypothetical protein
MLGAHAEHPGQQHAAAEGQGQQEGPLRRARECERADRCHEQEGGADS